MPNIAQWNPQKKKWKMSFRGVKKRANMARLPGPTPPIVILILLLFFFQ